MLHYPHFAVPNLFLANGYQELSSDHGPLTVYTDEDQLEECVRRVLVQLPVRFNGRQFRFLRQGLGLTQAAFGALVDRDAQTVARIEKDTGPVPAFVDLVARFQYLSRFAPQTAVGAIVTGRLESGVQLPERVILTNTAGCGWEFQFVGSIYTGESTEQATLSYLAAASFDEAVDAQSAYSLAVTGTTSTFLWKPAALSSGLSQVWIDSGSVAVTVAEVGQLANQIINRPYLSFSVPKDLVGAPFGLATPAGITVPALKFSDESSNASYH